MERNILMNLCTHTHIETIDVPEKRKREKILTFKNISHMERNNFYGHTHIYSTYTYVRENKRKY